MEIELDTFRPEHLPLLERWIRAPHVTFRRRQPEEDIELARALPPGHSQALIKWRGHHIGYLHWELLSREELDARGLPDVPANSLDVDILIGEVAAVGFGFGGRALKLLAESQRATREVPMMGMVVAVRNRPARVALLRAGFRIQRPISYPGYEPGDLIVMDLHEPA